MARLLVPVRMLPRAWCLDGEFVPQPLRSITHELLGDSPERPPSPDAAAAQVEAGVRTCSWRAQAFTETLSHMPTRAALRDAFRLRILLLSYARDAWGLVRQVDASGPPMAPLFESLATQERGQMTVRLARAAR